MLTTIFFLVTADIDSPENLKTLQFTSMLRCYEPSTYDVFSHRFHRLLPIKFQKTLYECALRGVTCEDRTVKSIALGRPNASNVRHRDNFHPYIINAHWMPSSTEKVHLSGVTILNGWRPETLPKSLKYFYMRGCHTLPLFVDVDKKALANAGRAMPERTMLSNLPQNLEEMYAISSGYAGGVCIQGLPRSLHILVLKERFRDIFIDFDEMSERLEHILVDTMFLGKNLKTYATGKQKGDPRVKVPYSGAELTDVLLKSAYYNEFKSKE